MRKIILFLLSVICIVACLCVSCGEIQDSVVDQNVADTTVNDGSDDSDNSAAGNETDKDGGQASGEQDGNNEQASGEQTTPISQNDYYTVEFDTDGGTSRDSQRVKPGEKAVKPLAPTKAATSTSIYTFKGWYLGDTEYDFNMPVNGNIVIKAVYETATYAIDIDI